MLIPRFLLQVIQFMPNSPTSYSKSITYSPQYHKSNSVPTVGHHLRNLPAPGSSLFLRHSLSFRSPPISSLSPSLALFPLPCLTLPTTTSGISRRQSHLAPFATLSFQRPLSSLLTAQLFLFFFVSLISLMHTLSPMLWCPLSSLLTVPLFPFFSVSLISVKHTLSYVSCLTPPATTLLLCFIPVRMACFSSKFLVCCSLSYFGVLLQAAKQPLSSLYFSLISPSLSPASACRIVARQPIFSSHSSVCRLTQPATTKDPPPPPSSLFLRCR